MFRNCKKNRIRKIYFSFNPKNKKIKIEDKVISRLFRGFNRSYLLDKGFNVTEKFILNLWSEHILASVVTQIDAKTKLQEYSLKILKSYLLQT